MPLSKIIRSVEHPRKVARRKIGAGDVVAAVAQPIAKAIDTIANTDLANCGGCTGKGGRKDQLNAAIPDVASLPAQVVENMLALVKGLMK